MAWEKRGGRRSFPGELCPLPEARGLAGASEGSFVSENLGKDRRLKQSPTFFFFCLLLVALGKGSVQEVEIN